MILADSHEYVHGVETSIWPLVLLLGLVAVVVVLVLLVLMRRRPQQISNQRMADGGRPFPPPSPLSSAPQVSSQPQSSSGGPVRQTARPGDYLYCDDTILDVLAQKGRPMTQKEICEDSGLTEQEVAGALAFMEERSMVRRKWDQAQSSYIVEAT